ncbi:C-type lectin domain family 4 member A isoform X2 [Haplochromis burtoni]|uniref:C-type lectin domain family 4 member A isoform X2 n=1 Tax=Haplochromis burtoni TaxID=8153 RepID=UPI001C2DBF5C|nr:C-type lectin domain family 4 member A isoform X2 [Haplochromis burtoni]
MRYWTSFHTNPSTEERWAVRWYLLLENKGLLVTEKLCIHAVITQEKSCADSLLDETMGVNNGSTLLEEEKKLEASKDRMVQLTLVSQSQSALQENKLRGLRIGLEKLNQSYQLLFSQYPSLNQYCPISNATTGERECSLCLPGWMPQGQKCFLFSQDRADWISSQYHCMALGGVMAIIRTEEEQEFLWEKAQSLSQGDSYWVGLRSSGADGGWQWSDGSLLEKGPQFWARDPDNAGESSVDLCGRLTPRVVYSRSWFTFRCSNKLRTICERRQASLT